MEVNKIYNINFLDNTLPDKCANLIIADPPYFEVKGDFDFVWKSFEEYLIDVEKWAVECKRLLADNGTLFWYGHAKKIAYAQIIFDKYFNLENNIAIEFNRQTKKGVELFRCFAPVSERLLMYSNDFENYYSPFPKIMNEYMIKLNLSQIDISKLELSRNGNITGWVHNKLSGEQLPTKEQWVKICNLFCIKNEYEKLIAEYELLRRPFNNFKKLFDIMSFDQEAHITKEYAHDTCKPETLTRTLILTCSRPNDLVLAPFAGSGTECAMAVKEGRKSIGFEITEKHAKMSNDRVQNILRQPSLFVGS